MKISADTSAELQEAIDAHAREGWQVVERQHLREGSYTATLERTGKLYECGLCKLTTINESEICISSYDLAACAHARALLKIKEIDPK